MNIKSNFMDIIKARVPDDLKKDVEQIAKNKYMNVSDFVRKAMRDAVVKEKELEQKKKQYGF